MYSSFSFLLIRSRTDVSEAFLRSTQKLKQLADFLFDGHKREKIGRLFFSLKQRNLIAHFTSSPNRMYFSKPSIAFENVR